MPRLPWRDRLKLVIVTDRSLAYPRSIPSIVAQALDAGAQAVQLRDKNGPAHDMLRTGKRLRELTRTRGALLFVNDRLDIALACDADGVHLGPEDMPIEVARQLVSSEFLIGYSTSCHEQARCAMSRGADYIGCGPVFATSTKSDAGYAIGTTALQAVASDVDGPVLAIGGIDSSNVDSVLAAGVTGIAVVRAVMAAPDPRDAVRRLLA